MSLFDVRHIVRTPLVICKNGDDLYVLVVDIEGMHVLIKRHIISDDFAVYPTIKLIVSRKVETMMNIKSLIHNYLGKLDSSNYRRLCMVILDSIGHFSTLKCGYNPLHTTDTSETFMAVVQLCLLFGLSK